MSRINLNIPAVQAQRQLAATNKQLQQSLQRLSSGLRINRGADDPAGLIVSTRLRTEISAAAQAIRNSERAINVIATGEGALAEIQNLLLDVRNLTIEAANSGAFSDEEIRANQLQIDSAVESITRIANTTNFAGRKLINGSLDFITSGVKDSALDVVSVFRAKFGRNTSIGVTVSILQSAEQAQLRFVNSSITTGSVTLELAGSEGVVSLTLNSGQTASSIIQAVNNLTDATGIQAVAISSSNASSGMIFQSVGYGSDEFVSINVINDSSTSGEFVDFVQDASGNTGVSRDLGQDVEALINGTRTLGEGLKAILNTTLLTLDLTFDPSFAQQTTSSTSFEIVGGGALFQLGPQVDPNQQEQIGIQSVTASRLGNSLTGFLSEIVTGGSKSLVNGAFREASDIIDLGLDQISVLRGRLGALERNMLDTNIRQLQITFENLTASESVIRDTDFAVETTELTRAQILQAAGTSVLAIANAVNQNVLSLLG
ncbi:MAG: flagellin [Planctomycetes bacterium]|nr:flagellin [Planctomycetota bacterium]